MAKYPRPSREDGRTTRYPRSLWNHDKASRGGEMSTTYTVKCRRCNGTGVWTGWTPAGRGGECFGCDGTGLKVITRYTAAEKAAIQERTQRRSRSLKLISARARELGTAAKDPELMWDAEYGFAALESREPERFGAMLSALESGRLDDVIRALADYYRNPKGS
jgi:hypothetical protein